MIDNFKSEKLRGNDPFMQELKIIIKNVFFYSLL